MRARIVLLVVVGALAAACATGKPGAKGAKGAPAAAGSGGDVARGQQIFEARCANCHPGGEARIGPSLKATVLPGPLQKETGHDPATALRHILPDNDYDAVLAYVRSLQAH
jgi:mono/diheme cytochrome c family protein